MKKTKRGFTLIEVLVVMGIIALLLVISLPAMTGVFKTSKLSQGANEFRDRVSLAHQQAIKSNRPVEVRIYKFDDPRNPGTDEYFAAYQFFDVLPNATNPTDPKAPPSYQPFTELFKLPQGVILTDTEKHSTLLGPSAKRKTEGIKGLIDSKTETEAEYCSFEIRPDGAMNLPQENRLWHVTFITLATINQGLKDDPDQYVCIQFDPSNTNMSWFQTK